MLDLYSRLFTYREREGRSPLEDFLSEAVADLLNRLPEARAREVVKLLLGARFDTLAALDRVWPKDKRWSWSTQRVIAGGGRIDLLMEVDGQPILVVESKVGAGFQEHRSGEQAEHQINQHQLVTYGKWIATQSGDEWGGALTLLTHWTPAPFDFLNDEAVYGCRHRHVLRWTDLARWLKGTARDTSAAQEGWAMLADELSKFLKVRDMDDETATSHDWAALQIYVSSADRVRNSIERVWNVCRSDWRSLFQQTDYPLELSTEYGCAWKFRYLAAQRLRRCYLAVGVRYPATSDYLSDVVSLEEPYLFMEIGCDIEPSPVATFTLPADWLRSKHAQIVVRPLRDMPVDADQFVSEAEAWARLRMIEITPLLS